MKKALFMIAAAAMFILAGCQKEQSLQESKTNDIIHINVGQITPATKVTANDITAETLTFSFEEGDMVAFLNAATKGITKFACTDSSNGTFEKTDGDPLDPDAEYYLFYPASYTEYSGGGYNEKYRGKQIPKEHLIVEYNVSGSSSKFTLSGHQAMIHFQLKGDAEIGSIEYQRYESGTYKMGTILVCAEAVQLSDTATDFYMDVLNTSNKGFKLVFKDASGNVLEEKTSNFDLSDDELEGTMVDFAEPITVNASSGPESV